MRHPAIFALLLPRCHGCAHAAAPADCWTLRKHGHGAEAQACFTALTRSADAYPRAEGFWGLEEWEQANEQFRLATQPANSKALYKVRWGMLLHERFNDGEAADLFHEALEKDPSNAEAYLGLALVSAESFDGKAAAYVLKAIALDPKLAEAHELLADLALANDDRDVAAVEADKAIALETDALDAMAIHAALELIANRSPDAWFAKIRAINPNYGEGYALVAHQLELHYRYEDAVTYYRKAIEADPASVVGALGSGHRAHAAGKEDEPYKELELSYENGYRDAATVNSLRLLDSYKNFETIRDDTTILKLNKTESDLLLPYMQAELHAILATYEKKYRMKLPGPVQVEVYPNHEDFAVRTMGMPGLGALGVTFGRVVAMDSPSARKPGDFNWGSTLWHEMSHVFILTATDSCAALVHRRAGRARRGRAFAGVEKRADTGCAGGHSRQEASAGREARSRLRLSGVSLAGDRLLFPGGQHLRLHQGEVGRRQAARHGPLLRAAEDHAPGHPAESGPRAGGIRQAISRVDRPQVWRAKRRISTTGARS